MTDDNQIHTLAIQGTVVRESETGIKVRIDVWLPKKFLEYIRYSDGQVDRYMDATRPPRARLGAWFTHLAMPYWLLRKKGLLDDRDGQQPRDGEGYGGRRS